MSQLGAILLLAATSAAQAVTLNLTAPWVLRLYAGDQRTPLDHPPFQPYPNYYACADAQMKFGVADWYRTRCEPAKRR